MKQGDTIQGLAIKYYGSARHASLITEANRQFSDPRRIPIGAKITIPPAPLASPAPPKVAEAGGRPTTRPAPASHSPAAQPLRQPPNSKAYVVKKGDNWYRLAAEYYGRESDYPQLFELNKRSASETVKSRSLRVGETIFVPLTSASSSVKPSSADSPSSASPTRTLMGTSPKP